MSDMSYSNTTDYPAVVASDTERYIEAFILTVIATLALVGNVSLWFIIIPTKRLKTCSNGLILSLSGADILVSAVNMPIIVFTLIAGEWRLSDEACVFFGLVTMVTFIASVMSLAAISINRYVMICHPNKYRLIYTAKKTALIIAGVWLLSFLLATPPLYGWAEYAYLPGQSFCFCNWKTSKSFTFFMVLVCFGGPCTAMTFSYVNILRQVRKSRLRVQGSPKKKVYQGAWSNSQYNSVSREKSDDEKDGEAKTTLGNQQTGENGTAKNNQVTLTVPLDRNPSYKKATETFPPPNAETPKKTERKDLHLEDSTAKIARAAQKKKEKARKEELRLTTSFLVVILVFVVSWLPFCVTMFWSVFSASPVPRIPDMITLLLGCFNSCCNPIIYGVMNSKFREGFKKLYLECRCCRKRHNDTTSSSVQKQSSSCA